MDTHENTNTSGTPWRNEQCWSYRGIGSAFLLRVAHPTYWGPGMGRDCRVTHQQASEVRRRPGRRGMGVTPTRHPIRASDLSSFTQLTAATTAKGTVSLTLPGKAAELGLAFAADKQQAVDDLGVPEPRPPGALDELGIRSPLLEAQGWAG